MKRTIVGAVIALTLLAVSSSARAKPGLRIGLTDSPDTLGVGFFFENVASRLGNRSVLSIEPGIDLGFGSDLDFITVRGTFNLKFVFFSGNMQFYPIVGMSLYYLNVDNGGDDTVVGVNLGGGMQFDRFSFELMGGIGHAPFPDITFWFGIAF